MTAEELVATYGPDVIAEARSWCEDVVADPDTVDEATDDDVLGFVARHYEGGVAAFLADGLAEVLA
jgi:hypothetical protein